MFNKTVNNINIFQYFIRYFTTHLMRFNLKKKNNNIKFI